MCIAMYYLRRIDMVILLQGTSDEIPLYLRTEGSIRNRRIGKDEGSRLISGFWKFRLSSSSENLDKQVGN